MHTPYKEKKRETGWKGRKEGGKERERDRETGVGVKRGREKQEVMERNQGRQRKRQKEGERSSSPLRPVLWAWSFLSRSKGGKSKVGATYHKHQKPELTNKTFYKEPKISCFLSHGLSMPWCQVSRRLMKSQFTISLFPLDKSLLPTFYWKLQPKEDQRPSPSLLNHR